MLFLLGCFLFVGTFYFQDCSKLSSLSVYIGLLIGSFYRDFAKLQKATINFVMSVSSSTGTTLLSQEEFLRHLIFKYEGWNFNFGNTPLDWIQELLE